MANGWNRQAAAFTGEQPRASWLAITYPPWRGRRARHKSERGFLGGSAGVSPAVAGASRSRIRDVSLYRCQERSIQDPDEAQEGAARMLAPQRARRPRYLTALPRRPLPGFLCYPAAFDSAASSAAWGPPRIQETIVDVSRQSQPYRLRYRVFCAAYKS